MDSHEKLTIGQLSAGVGVTTETIRYYEQVGVLPVPRRLANGYRYYDSADVERLQFVKRSRALDFAVQDIQEILAFHERNAPPCAYVLQLMEQKLDEVSERIADLQQLQRELQALHAAGKELPEDVRMKECVCHLIRTEDSTA